MPKILNNFLFLIISEMTHNNKRQQKESSMLSIHQDFELFFATADILCGYVYGMA
jgi:hypothetical protein